MMKTEMHKDRPRYLNLMKIRLPVTGVVSILHRITGVFMILCIPLCAFLLQRSLHSETGFSEAQSLLDNLFIQILVALGLWSVAHHLLAGIRFLLFDIDVGVEKSSARRAAWSVIVGDAAILAVILWWLV